MNIETEIAKALMRVSGCKGVVSYIGDDEVYIKSGHVNDYLLMMYIGQLIERGEMKIEVNPDRINYMKKLLHITGREAD